MRVEFLDVDGVRTRVLSAGEGHPVFLLHGVGMSGDIFVRNIDALAKCATVYAPDLLGHGFTDAADFGKAAPQAAMATHLNKLADRLGVERCVLGGTSFGALVAGLAYFERPARASGLVLIGSGSCFHGADEQVKTLQAAAANAERAMVRPTLDSCRKRMANIVFDPKMVAEEVLLLQLTSYALPDRFAAYKATIEGSIANMYAEDSRILERLEEIAVPTLVIVGRDDIRASWEAHEKAVTRIPDGALTIYEQAGHMPFMEHPETFNREMEEFVGRAAAGGAHANKARDRGAPGR